MRSIQALTFMASLLAAASPAAQPSPARPTATPAGTQAVVSEVTNTYAAMEKNVELTSAKLIQESNGQKEALEEKIRALEHQIVKLQMEFQTAKYEIAAIEKQTAKLEQDKEKAIADLKKQKQKAIADVQKAQDARLIRTPTPTPTPKRP
jgi:septal ring factor EnvC (AmiA/AmiB activator)